MFYEEVFNELNKNNVRYLVVGGIAVVLHGVVRLTADLDLMIDLEKGNVLNFLASLKNISYKPKLPVPADQFADPDIRDRWIKEKNMKVFSFIHGQHDYKIIDVFPFEPIPFSPAYNRRQRIKAGQIDINVISFDDLISLKKIASRGQDIDDIKMLEELRAQHGPK